MTMMKKILMLLSRNARSVCPRSFSRVDSWYVCGTTHQMWRRVICCIISYVAKLMVSAVSEEQTQQRTCVHVLKRTRCRIGSQQSSRRISGDCRLNNVRHSCCKLLALNKLLLSSSSFCTKRKKRKKAAQQKDSRKGQWGNNWVALLTVRENSLDNVNTALKTTGNAANLFIWG